MSTLTATVRESGQGEQRWFCGGGKHTWLASAEETGGAFLMFEFVGEQNKVTPLHIHPGVDETFYVLDGEIELDLSGERRSLSTGGIVVIKRGEISFRDFYLSRRDQKDANMCIGAQVFVDGVPMSQPFNINSISPGLIRGVEIYTGPATTPSILRTSKTVCGTVAIWTIVK